MTADRTGAGGAARGGRSLAGDAPTPDPLERAARRWPRRTALDGPGGRRSWEALDGAASGLAALLRGAGAGPGGRVAFLLPRGEGAVALLHAVPRTGAAAAPLHAGWTEPELADYLARLSPSHLVCSGDTADAAGAALPAGAALVRVGPGWPPAEGAEVLRPGEPVVGRLAGGRPAKAGASGGAPPPGRRPAEAPPLHTILSTSGTSGRPKAVGLTLSAHVACARATERRMLLGPADRWLASLSPAHVGGVALVIRSAWTGAALVLRERFDAGELAGLAAAGRVTHASLVPTMLRRLLDARGRRPAPLPLRGILLGGDAADPGEVLAALELDYPLFPTYGLSEAASQVATARPEEARLAPESVGRPLAGTEVRIGEGDEILVRGPTLMAGYVLGPGGDREPGSGTGSDRGHEPGGLPREGGVPAPGAREPGLDAGGWLHTGDAGRLDDEGRLFVTGRLSRRLVSGGVTVDPARVERVLAAHPSVREAAVVGLPDPEWGERVAAAVVPSAPAPPTGEAAERLRRVLEAHCRERLAAPALPRAWILVKELPRNPNGKLDMEAVRRLVAKPRA